MKYLYLLLIILAPVLLLGQNSSRTENTHIAEARVFDHVTKKPVGYASVYNLQNQTGTLTNSIGYFQLLNVSKNDTLIISFVGYQKLKITGAEVDGKDSIFIYPKDELLHEVVILSDDAVLYNLVSNCQKNPDQQLKTARTYFELESYVNEKQVELVECYYNGIFSGYDLSKLQLKNGRFALAPFGDRIFISTQTTEALLMQKTFEANSYFPTSPLALTRGQLKKQFHLSLSSKFKNENASIVYVIDYKPKDTNRTHFSGTIWIDSMNNQILKITQLINLAAVHPFAAIAREDGLSEVNLSITKTYTQTGTGVSLRSIDFDYNLRYKYHKSDSIQTISTQAILYAYNYTTPFTLPYFHFTDGMYGDYVKILAVPYNSFFWNHIEEFKMHDQKNKNDHFFQLNGNNTSASGLFTKSDTIRTNFEKPYIFWSENRVVFREDLNNNIVQTKIGGVPSDFYNLEVQVYLDANLFNDTLHILSATIFDPFETYFYYPINAQSLTFINIYFDLIEIQRRELEAEILAGEKSEWVIKKAYERRLDIIENLSQTYFKEVERGTNQKAILKWNSEVSEKLNIDNVAIFKPFE